MTTHALRHAGQEVHKGLLLVECSHEYDDHASTIDDSAADYIVTYY
jgi:hypothetical protein